MKTLQSVFAPDEDDRRSGWKVHHVLVIDNRVYDIQVPTNYRGLLFGYYLHTVFGDVENVEHDVITEVIVEGKE